MWNNTSSGFTVFLFVTARKCNLTKIRVEGPSTAKQKWKSMGCFLFCSVLFFRMKERCTGEAALGFCLWKTCCSCGILWSFSDDTVRLIYEKAELIWVELNIFSSIQISLNKDPSELCKRFIKTDWDLLPLVIQKSALLSALLNYKENQVFE